MDVPLATSGMQILSRAACLRLLAGQRVGRLAFLVGDQPMVLPVNFALHGDVVVFRTAEGTKLDAAAHAKVAFEVDEVDARGEAGWSVVIQGVAEEITDDERWYEASLRHAVPPSWLPGPAEHYVRITPRLISGRRLLRSTA